MSWCNLPICSFLAESSDTPMEGEGGVTEGLCGPGSQGSFGKGHSVQVRDLLETGHSIQVRASGEVQSVQIR
jgi:hypothetical protein